VNSVATMNASGDPWFFAVTLFFVLLTIVAGTAALYIVRRRRGAHEMAGRAESGMAPVTRNMPRRAQKFYGVTVKPGISTCAAVEKIRGHRYLTLEAPKLPLPDCSSNDCRCILLPEDDRRAGFDRRDDRFSAYGDFDEQKIEHGRGERTERRKK
jgi:hypothetical protein